MQSKNGRHQLRDGLEKNNPSYFVKYNSFHGVAVSPDSNVLINTKEKSCFEEDYYWEVACRLGLVITRC